MVESLSISSGSDGGSVMECRYQETMCLVEGKVLLNVWALFGQCQKH